MDPRSPDAPGRRARRAVVSVCTVLVMCAAGLALVRYAVDDLVVTRDLLQSSERDTQARLEAQRDCLGDRLDRLIPDGAKVRVRVPPPAAHRIIEALLPGHQIVEGDPKAQGAWLIESSRSSTNTGCLRGLQIVAP